MTAFWTTKTIPLVALLLIFSLVATPVLAQADLAPGVDSNAEVRQIAVASPSVRLSGGVQLSPEATAMAAQLDLYERIEHFTHLKQKLTSTAADKGSLEFVALRQDVSEAHHELMRVILKTNLEIDYVLAAIDGEQNDYTRLSAALAGSRDTGILVNTIIAQLINGVFWSLSGVYSLASIRNPYATNVDGVSSIVAGFLPAALGLYSLYQARGPKRTLPKHPNMLAPIFIGGTTDDGYYPDSVMKYLNSAPPNQSTTRKQALVEEWTKNKFIGKNGAITGDTKMQLAAGTIEKRRALTISLVQTRQTMLADVRTEVIQMKRGLVELMPLLEQ